MKQYIVNVVYKDGSKGSYHLETLKQAKSIYKMYLNDMTLLNVKSVGWSIV